MIMHSPAQSGMGDQQFVCTAVLQYGQGCICLAPGKAQLSLGNGHKRLFRAAKELPTSVLYNLSSFHICQFIALIGLLYWLGGQHPQSDVTLDVVNSS